MNAILVTGGAGYIGSHVCKQLHVHGYLPICYDTMENGHKWAVNWGPLEIGNVNDKDRLTEVIKKYNIKGVMHLAGYIDVAESILNYDKYILNNYTGPRVLIEAMLDHNIVNIVFASTCAIYKAYAHRKISETYVKEPMSPYAKSKLFFEECLIANVLNGLRVVSLRFFNATGSDNSGLIGEAHKVETHLMPIVVDHGLKLRNDKLQIFGDNYNTFDGTCIRDYVHVNDIALAHIMSLKYLESKTLGIFEAFNVGSGIGYSVKEIVTKTASLLDTTIEYDIHNKRPGDSPILVADITKINKILNWNPRYDLQQQLVDTINWRSAYPFIKNGH